MGYLLFVAFFFLLAATFRLAHADKNDCQLRDGSMLTDGQKTSDTCTSCYCRSGELKCQIQLCGYPNCWDSTLVPGQCCPTCPNGPNCLLLDGGTLPAGRTKVMTNGQICNCPRSFSGRYLAVCLPHDVPITAY